MTSKSFQKPYLRIAGLAMALLLALPTLASAMDSPLGIWVIGDGQARIRLENCAEGLCGTIVWLADPLDPKTQKPRKDINNHDPSLRARPIVGLQILTLKADGNQQWKGTIYNSRDGRNYDSTLKINGDNLDLRGCVLDMLCKTQSWVRYNQK